MTRICTCRFCGKDDLTPQGHKSHETHCDENPNPGISYDQQKELGLLNGEEGADGARSPNPDQSASKPTPSLPDVTTLSGGENSTGKAPVTDGGEEQEPSECPICGDSEVLPAGEAKDYYVENAQAINAKAVLGYELADWSCQEPSCAALWGEKYDQPLTMKEVVEA